MIQICDSCGDVLDPENHGFPTCCLEAQLEFVESLNYENKMLEAENEILIKALLDVNKILKKALLDASDLCLIEQGHTPDNDEIQGFADVAINQAHQELEGE